MIKRAKPGKPSVRASKRGTCRAHFLLVGIQNRNKNFSDEDGILSLSCFKNNAVSQKDSSVPEPPLPEGFCEFHVKEKKNFHTGNIICASTKTILYII